MRVTPRPLIGVAILVGYIVYFTTFLFLTGIDYDEITDTTENVLWAIVVPVGLGCLILAAIATWLGWWGPALFEERPGPRWLLLLPLAMLGAITTSIVTGDLGDHATGFLLTLALGMLCVGFAEEFLTRGLAIVAFRGGMGEVGVWFFSSLAFGLLHGVNIILGAAVGSTIQQITFAFVFGSVFYVVRRATGTLLVCMALHALWDFSVFISSGDEHTGTVTSAGAVFTVFMYATVIIAAVGLWKLLRGGPRNAAPRAATA